MQHRAAVRLRGQGSPWKGRSAQTAEGPQGKMSLSASVGLTVQSRINQLC